MLKVVLELRVFFATVAYSAGGIICRTSTLVRIEAGTETESNVGTGLHNFDYGGSDIKERNVVLSENRNSGFENRDGIPSQ